MAAPLDICLFGAGRIGAIHASNITAHSAARLKYVVDPNPEAADALARACGAAVAATDEALGDPAVGAVVIASSTDTHVDLITRSARAGKAVFCEKPMDLDLARVDRCVAELEAAGVPFMLGFNRRFDPSFSELRAAVRRGELGRVEMVTIISRDPRPPPIAYVEVSGGLFRDMMIHDLDMAAWLLDERIVEVTAAASCLIDPAIGAAGDVDTAMVLLRAASGALCHIQNSRRAAYGYDQRIEVFGERGLLSATNRSATTVARWSGDGVLGPRPMDFFLDRYAQAYREEIGHFVDAVTSGKRPEVGARDGRRALALAEAALESARTRRAVEVPHRR
ncbi:MAG: inositol 2-dehydrogenase [Deltaproteobacteria bacterium]|nr:inositol 2-dehydrogenase [Deltaproteobacteria bacterium]